MLLGFFACLATLLISYNRHPSHQFKKLEAMAAAEMEVAVGPFDCLDNQVSKGELGKIEKNQSAPRLD
jgi:hypothetical protein